MLRVTGVHGRPVFHAAAIRMLARVDQHGTNVAPHHRAESSQSRAGSFPGDAPSSNGRFHSAPARSEASPEKNQLTRKIHTRQTSRNASSDVDCEVLRRDRP